MLISNRFDWRQVLHHGWQPALVSAVCATIVTTAYIHFDQRHLSISPVLTGVLGSALAVVLGFKNNSAYARWWEARTLWGSVVNDCRTFARQALTLLPSGHEQVLVRRQLAFANALRVHLRDHDDWEAVARFLEPVEAAVVREAANPPLALLLAQGRAVAVLAPNVHVQLELDATLTRLCNSLGACERIKNTPFPRQYQDLAFLLVWCFCLASPFSMVGELGYWSIPATVILCLVFQGLVSIGKNLQDPFDLDVNDIPMVVLCQGLAASLGEGPMPQKRMGVVH